MLASYFEIIRRHGVPVTLREYLDLLGCLKHRVIDIDMEEFYYLSRACMAKDERYFDRFDRGFTAFRDGMETLDQLIEALIPEEWLRKQFEANISEEDLKKIKSFDGLDKLIEEFKKRLEEQKKRHQGGNKWIGTAGTSPFGHGGKNPQGGIRIGGEGGQQRANKIWEKREYRNLDGSVEIGIRNMKIALRRLRKMANEGVHEELDIDSTIRNTAKNGGMIDIAMMKQQANATRLLVFFDIGGSMDVHVRLCEELFSAVRTEFQHLEYFYFHNCLYETVWKDNRRRHAERMATGDIFNKYGPEYNVLVIGDASMAPYEISAPGGSIEHWNEEPGQVWLERLAATYPKMAWLNPIPREFWQHSPSTMMVSEAIGDYMYPLTLDGLDEAAKALQR